MRPITMVLAEFSPGPGADAPAAFDLDGEFATDLSEPVDDGAAREVAARSALITEVQANEQAACAGRMDALAQGHAAELAEARTRWAAEEGAALAAALADGLARIEAAIAAGLAGAMLPVLGEAVRARASAEVADAVRRLLAGGYGEVIEVRGAPDLVAPVRLAFADHPAVAVLEADRPDVSVSAGDAVIASQIELWRDRLHEALETKA